MSGYNLTKIGLIFLIVGMIMGIIPSAILSFIDVSNVAAGLGLGIVAGLGAIFLFVALIILWVAGIGLKEYGKKHSKFTLISLILFLVAIGVTIAVSVITAFSMFSSISSGDFSGYKVIYLLTPISAVFMGLVYLFLLHELENSYGKIILYISFISMIVVSCAIAYIGYTGFEDWYNSLDLSSSNPLSSISSNEFVTALTERTNQLNLFSIIPNILFLVSAIIPIYRISTEDLKKVPKVAQGRKCNNCGFEIPQYSDACPKCGQFYGAVATESTPVFKYCPECGHKNEEGIEFCEECGTKF